MNTGMDFAKIRYYDLKLEALKGRLKDIVGRTEELSRLTRVMSRTIDNNCLIVGPSGIGKTALVHAWAKQSVQEGQSNKLPIVEFDPESFEVFNSATPVPFQRYVEALESLPKCILFIDNFGHLIYNKATVLHAMFQLVKPHVESGKIQLLLVMEQAEFKWLAAESPSLLNLFEVIAVKPQSDSEQEHILAQAWAALSPSEQFTTTDSIFPFVIQLVERFPALGQLPAAAIRILDESLALVKDRKSNTIGEEEIYQVVSDKVGVPLTQLKISEKELLQKLELRLNRGVVGQTRAIAQIATTIQRAKLGLKNPNRPLGSFLVLGPSGVGKTETAKLVAQTVFGKKESFVRIDMSEFGEAHTVARLIGAPAGYVGFDQGGGLTNAVKQEPYSLVLLDEAEKAHPKIFDVFLQLLDDGRLTSGQGETVDFTQTIIMATTNIAVPEIIEGFTHGEDIASDEFIQNALMPALTKVFRLEFLNRFDAILVFKPLTLADLLEIAKLEIQKVEERVAKYNIIFKIDPAVLAKKIESLCDPRFGARPVKRFIETTCETLITQKLLAS